MKENILLKILVLSILLLITLSWIIGLTTAPKIEVSLVDVKVTFPDNWWEQSSTSGLKQIEYVFEFTNKYNKSIPLFGVYSPKMESYSKAVRGVNYDFHQNLASCTTDTYSVFYLVENETIVHQIDIETDFIAYASFTMNIISESAEKTWRGNKFFAPFFKVSLLKVTNKHDIN